MEHKIFLGQQSIQCTGMKSGPMSPTNGEEKAPSPKAGQGQEGQRNIYDVMGSAELKDVRTRKDLRMSAHSMDVVIPECVSTLSGQSCSSLLVLQGDGGQGPR